VSKQQQTNFLFQKVADSQPEMESLNTYCFSPIFSNLSILDCLHLRLVSRRLKEEIDIYLPTVRSISLYLTTPRPPEMIEEYENLFRRDLKTLGFNSDSYPMGPLDVRLGFHQKIAIPICAKRLAFGASGRNEIEDGSILHHQSHFRRDNFLILNSSDSLSKFLSGSQKHCPNIVKLAVVIDHFDYYFPFLSSVFRSFPALKVLLIDRTLQDTCRLRDPSDFPLWDRYTEPGLRYFLEYSANKITLPTEVYESILELTSLEELYFFSKRQSHLTVSQDPEDDLQKFLAKMIRKLKIFHLNTGNCLNRQKQIIPILPVEDMPDGGFSQLVELGCDEYEWLYSYHRVFPSLKKLIILTHWSDIWRVDRDTPDANLINCPQPTVKFLNFMLKSVSKPLSQSYHN